MTHERLDDEYRTYGPGCYVCRRRVEPDGHGGWQHVSPPRRPHAVVVRDELRSEDFRAVCSCGWTGPWERSDVTVDETFDWHVLEAPKPPVWASARGESTQAFMQRTDPVAYQQCREAGRF